MDPDRSVTGPASATAERIAAVGRAHVHRRLHVALAQQAQLAGLTLPPAEAERLVSEGAARAGAALWRLSLAEAAAVELGLELESALWHPEVELAHEMTGAPAFGPGPRSPGTPAESSPATVAALPRTPAGAGTPTVPAAPDTPAGAGTPTGAAAQRTHEPPATAPAARPDPGASQAPAAPPAPGAPQRTLGPQPTIGPHRPVTARPPHGSPDAPPGSPPPHPDAIRVAAIHVGGLEAVRAGERDLELRFSPAGMDVLVRSSGAPIGRLRWDQIRTVELPRRRRGLRGLRGAQELHVETDHGRASFELPGVSEQELGEHLAPLLERKGG